MNSLCQGCGQVNLSWQVHQATLHVGLIDHWSVQLCPTCTTKVEHAIRDVLSSPRRLATPDEVR